MRLRIDLRQMECFVAVAEEGSFRAAAERLHMSQPPLSRQIRLLEEALGVTLLLRGSSGATPTLAGRKFLVEARSALGKATRAVEVARRHRDEPPRALRVGFTTFFDPDVVLAVEPAYRKQVPGGVLRPIPGISVDLLKALRRNALDVALVGLPCNARGLVVEPLKSDPLYAMLPSSHPLARQRTVSVKQLQDEPMFWLQRKVNPGLFDHFEELLARAGCDLRQRLPGPVYHLMLLARVARGQGVSLTPKTLTRIKRKGVVFRPLREKEFWIGYGVAYKEKPASAERTALLEIARARTRQHIPKTGPKTALTLAYQTEPATTKKSIARR